MKRKELSGGADSSRKGSAKLSPCVDEIRDCKVGETVSIEERVW